MSPTLARAVNIGATSSSGSMMAWSPRSYWSSPLSAVVWTRGRFLLTAVAGAIAGGASMAAGEYLATKSQDEVLEAELRLERTHIRDFREMEVDQLRDYFTDMGIRS